MTKASILAVIDAGTTQVKGALYAWHGAAAAPSATLLRQGQRPSPVLACDGLKVEQDLAGMLRAISAVVQELAAEVPAAEWRTLVLLTQRGCFVPLDSEYAPLTPLLSWLDRRGGRESRWSWLVREKAELAGRARYAASMHSWLVWALSGEFFDTAQTVAPEAASSGLIAPDSSAVVRASFIRPSAATQALGLPPGLPLIAAGGDKNGELIGAGGFRPGHGVVSFGTAVSFGVLRPPGAPLAGVYTTPAHVPGLLQAEVGLPNGGGVWAWAQRLFADHAPAALDEARTPLFIPYLSGSLGAAAATGSWHSLTPAVGAGDLLTSALEGVVLELMRGAKDLGAACSELTLVGGGASSPVLGPWLAEALACPVRLPSQAAAGVAGGAMIAAVELDLAADLTAAFAALAGDRGVLLQPTPQGIQRWQRRYTRWHQLLLHACLS